jgi:AcrR family transcriptional regulator
MEKPNETRQRILEAAIHVFATKGYHDTRVDEIVEASHTSKGAVYFHFPGKRQIFLGLVDEFAHMIERQIKTAIERENSGIGRVNAALAACLSTFGQYRQLAKIFLVQASGLGAAFEEKQRQVHTRFAQLIQQYLDQAVADGDIPALDTEVASLAWMGAINEVVIHWVHAGQPEPERMLPTLRRMLLQSIGVEAARIQQFEPQTP